MSEQEAAWGLSEGGLHSKALPPDALLPDLRLSCPGKHVRNDAAGVH